MQNILEKYPVENKDDTNTYRPFFSFPDISLDLHGYSIDESEKKLSWILEHAQYNRYNCVRIITGIGKKILKPFVRRKLQVWKSQNKITDYTEIVNENMQKTGVFLYIV